MQKEIFVNVDPRETRVAIVEDGFLVELHMEREERVVGSVYKARVTNVLPGMDASFVDIGLEKNAFLYVGDILTDDSSDEGDGRNRGRRRTYSDAKIRDLVKPGQDILVQVVKAPRGTKGARVSTRVSLPGRYLVFMPDAGNVGISRKIEDVHERDRLKRAGERIRKEGGIIIRTEAEGRSEAELRDDYRYLLNVWHDIKERFRTAPPASVLHQEMGLLFRVVRDMLSADIFAVVIDSPEGHERSVELANALSPGLADKLLLYDETTPLFEAYGIEKEIERLAKPKVWLKSGGYLRIDETEALTSIDVNTGKFVGATSLNETILRTNLESANEIVRQLRFRDLGGMIILDFIDMSSAEDRKTVMRALDNALKQDRTRTKVAAISPLGLIEMTRKRTGENLSETLRDHCPYCEGRGTVQSALTTAVRADHELRGMVARDTNPAYYVCMHPDVAVEFIGEWGGPIHKLEQDTGRAVYARPDPNAHREKFSIAPADVPLMQKSMRGLKPGKVLDLTVEAYGTGDDLRSIAWHNGILVEVINGAAHIGQTLQAKLTNVSRSYMMAELVGVPTPPGVRPDTRAFAPAPYPKAAVKADRELQPEESIDKYFTTDRAPRYRRRGEESTTETEAKSDKPVKEPKARGGRAQKPVVFEVVPVPAPEPAATSAELADARKRKRRGRRRHEDVPEGETVLVSVEAETETPSMVSVETGPEFPKITLPVTEGDAGEEPQAVEVAVKPGGHVFKRWPRRRKGRPGRDERGGSDMMGSDESL